MEITTEFWCLVLLLNALTTVAISAKTGGGTVISSPLFVMGLSLKYNSAIGAALAQNYLVVALVCKRIGSSNSLILNLDYKF